MLPLVIDPSHLDSFAYMLREQRLPTAKQLERMEGDTWEQERGNVADNGFYCHVELAGTAAVIAVQGPIDYKMSYWSRSGHMTSSDAVRRDFKKLMDDDEITRIVFNIDSPGGLYSGLPELARDIFEARGKKQLIALANPLAASGALWLGAAAEKFFVLGSGNAGSLGAIMLHQDMSRYLDLAGVTITILRKPEAKADFNPFEPLSDESREHHQRIINDIADEFTTAMARFRSVSKQKAASAFGQGRVLSAADAVEAGLVDGVVTSLASVVGPRVRSSKRVKLHPRLELARLRNEKKTSLAS